MKLLFVILYLFVFSINAFSQVVNLELLPAQDSYKVKIHQNTVYWIDSAVYSNGAADRYTFDSLGNRISHKKEPADPKAELHIVDDQVPDTLGVGTHTQHPLKAWNSGVVPASNFSIKAFLSSDSLYNSNDPSAGLTPFNDIIAVNSYKDIPGNIQIPDTTTANRWYWLFFHIDHNDQVVEYSDSNNIYSTKVFISECATAPQLNPQVVASICNRPNGSISLNVPQDYSIEWFNGSGDTVLNNLDAGTYTYQLTANFNSCTYEDTITVSGLPELQLQANIQDATCNENNGAVGIVPSSGVAPYSYNWSNLPDTSHLGNLTPGQYTVEVSDSLGCNAILNVEIQAVSPPLLSFDPTHTTCGEDNGLAAANVVAGTGPYTYAWSNGDTSSTAVQLTAGLHSLTVTDASGCTVDKTVRINPSNAININIKRSGTQLKAEVGNATPPLSYAWSNGENENSIRAIENGSYELTVTDGNNCTAISSISIDNIDPTTAVQDLNGSSGRLYVFPNPSDGTAVMLHCEVGEEVWITVYKENGQLIYEDQAVPDFSNTIRLNNNFISGTYILFARSAEGEQIGARIFIVN